MFFLHAYAEPVGRIGEIRHKQGAGCADGDCRRLTGDIYAELPQQPQTAAVGLDVAFLERPQRVERVFALGRRERGQILHFIEVEEAVGNIGFEGAALLNVYADRVVAHRTDCPCGGMRQAEMNIRRGGQIRLAVLVRGNVERARHGRTAKADCLIQQQGSGEALLTGGAVQAVYIRQPRGGQAGTKRNIHNIGGRCGQGEKMGQSNAPLATFM